MPKKEPTTVTIEGLFITEDRQARVGQALKIALAQNIPDFDGNTVAITFRTQS